MNNQPNQWPDGKAPIQPPQNPNFPYPGYQQGYPPQGYPPYPYPPQGYPPYPYPPQGPQTYPYPPQGPPTYPYPSQEHPPQGPPNYGNPLLTKPDVPLPFTNASPDPNSYQNQVYLNNTTFFDFNSPPNANPAPPKDQLPDVSYHKMDSLNNQQILSKSLLLPMFGESNENSGRKNDAFDIYSRDMGLGNILKQIDVVLKDMNTNPGDNVNQNKDDGSHLSPMPDPKKLGFDLNIIAQALNSMSKSFNDADIPIINQNNKIDSGKYWTGLVNKDAGKEIDQINNAPKNQVTIDRHLKPPASGANKLEVSNFFGVVKLKDRNEEDAKPVVDSKKVLEDIFADQTVLKAVNNWAITSFVPTKTRNCLDDLDELLAKSQKFAEAKVKTQGSKYKDEAFPPHVNSIWGFDEPKRYRKADYEKFVWCHPEEYFTKSGYKGTPKLYDTIDSNDIMQGSLGDCYFLAAIASIAKRHERLERLFLVKDYNAQGIYVIALCINGIWEDIVIDDMVPCQPYSKEPAFNHSKSGELWVMMLEKAWAKIHGGYLNIAAGLTREALRDLTGASAKTVFVSPNKPNNELWEEIYEANSRSFILCAGSDDLNSGSDAYIEKIGIAGSHAYSLLDVIELLATGSSYRPLRKEERKSADPRYVERLVKLRNPWGKGEWKGDWSDSSPKWTSDLKRQLNVVQREDGIFYMSFKDFCKYYSDVQICYYHDNYKYSAIKIQNPRTFPCYFSFTLAKAGEYYFSINQHNRRFFKKNAQYEYSSLSMIIGGESNGAIEYIGCSMKADKENWVCKVCKPGKYYVVVQTPWVSSVNEFSFSIYGPQKAEIHQVDRSALPSSFMENLFKSHASQEKTLQLQPLSEKGVGYKLVDTKNGFGYLLFVNETPSVSVDITVEMVNSKNVKLCEPYIGLRPTVQVPPNTRKILAYEATTLPYLVEMRLISSFKRSQSDYAKIAKEKGTRLRKYKSGGEVNINLYMLYHADGFIMYYENNTPNLVLSEKVRFALENCHIEGIIGDHVEIAVYPNSSKSINIVQDDPSRNFRAKVQNLDYEITAA